MKFFTSDPHLDHDGILKIRPMFKTVRHMNKEIIKGINSIVGDGDELYIIGDYSLRNSQYMRFYEDTLNQINGIKHLILGNHDSLKPFDYVELGFLTVHTALELEGMILVHDPCVSCIDRNRVFLCGHIHDLFRVYRNVINVGVEVNNYLPLSLSEIRNLITTEVKLG
jgi:calcineurin-like phosphoesterase family protein